MKLRYSCDCGRVCGGEGSRREIVMRRSGVQWAWRVIKTVMMMMVIMVFGPCVSSALARKESTSPLKYQIHSKCPMAFHEVGGSCYFYGYFPLNWFRAAEFCHSFGSGVSLATIETLQENYFIKKWLAVNGHHNTGVWVGGSDNGHSGKWAWFPTGQLVSYSNWGPSQPSGGDQHCMYLVGGLLGYQWADFHCEFDMHFLCEHGVNTVEPWR
ncbi:LOW QUALITY PROTEIN: perlucin-like [Homarus americanus]|uniref:LOW QUALITY PROTEIN: perlucin-like n=1 Tax=Homarus americanus TaxID=6706 RepID=UPI001C45981A|nr:LOW QUALITY PROTEIN: perlucin-like [Homarus americanus]